MERWLRECGPVVSFAYLHLNYVIVGSPEAARHVFATRLSNYRKDQSAYAVFGDVLGTGLVTSEGNRWRRQRALIAPGVYFFFVLLLERRY